jgi:hypothetical protein
MESNLRPMTLGEILDRTAQLYRSNFLLFAGISIPYASVLLVLGLIQIGLTETLHMTHAAEQLQVLTVTTAGIIMPITFLIYGIVMAATIRAVAWVHLGKPASIRGAYTSILPRWGRYLWLMTITGLIVFTPIVLLYYCYFGIMSHYVTGFGVDPAAQQAAMSNPQTLVIMGAASCLFMLLFIPAVIYTILMGMRYSLAVPACVVENLKARQAIRRSIDLAQGSWGRIFLLWLLVFVIKLGVVVITQFFIFVPAFKHPGQMPGPGISALSTVIGFFTNTLLGPIWATGIALLYFDQRVRKEGYDIEWMMQAAGLASPDTLQIPGAAHE